ncbi:putative ribonuclease H-like domain-containing protein [Tanacetum coccineum]
MVLSEEFQLPDASQVVLRIPRKHDLYSKAYRVYNLPNKRVEETLNLRFLEDKPNVQGIGHEWYFDLDYLTDSLGYTRFKTDTPAGTQESNIPAGTQAQDSDSDVEEQVIVVPSFPSNSFAGPSSSNDPSVMECNADYAEELAKLQRQEYEAKDAIARYGYLDPAGIGSAGGVSASSPSVGSDPAVSTSISADFIPVHADESTLPPGQSLGSSENTKRFPVPSDVCKDQPSSGIFTSSSYDDDFSATLTNLAPAVEVNPVPTKKVNTIHPQSQILGDLASPVLTRSRAQKSMFGESAFIGYIQDQQRTNHTDQLHCLSGCFLSQFEPTSIAKALEDPDWVDAMQEEMQQFINQKVWKLVPLPDGKHAIGTKWILKNKRDARGIVVRKKARLVAQGHRQEEGIDYDEVKGGIVKFGGGDGRISGKGTIRTSKLDFENVYYVEELHHFNLFSVSQISDKKNKVLFTDTDCLVLTEEFQLPDESQVLSFLLDAFFLLAAYIHAAGVVYAANTSTYAAELVCAGSIMLLLVDVIPAGLINKTDEGYLVGYAPNSKAYRVYNLTNKRVEETMNLRFLEDKPNVQGIGHEWYFDLDYLTDSFGYTRFKTNKPAGTQETNINAGTQDHDSDSEVDEQVIVVPSFPSNSFAAIAEILSQAEAADRDPAGIDSAGGVSAGSTSAGSDPAGGNPAGHFQPAGSYEPAGQGNPAVSTSVSADFIPVHADESTLPPGQSLGSSENTTRFPVPSDVCKDNLSSGIFTSSSYDDDFSATLTNLAPAVEVNPVPTKRVNTIHPQSQIIGDLASPVLTRSRAQKSKFGESAFIGYIQDQQRTNHTDQLHCLFACFLSQLEPTSIAKALEDPDWVAAMQEEMQ